MWKNSILPARQIAQESQAAIGDPGALQNNVTLCRSSGFERDGRRIGLFGSYCRIMAIGTVFILATQLPGSFGTFLSEVSP
jgi:hypothetical protein